jgi:hypothetical protein
MAAYFPGAVGFDVGRIPSLYRPASISRIRLPGRDPLKIKTWLLATVFVMLVVPASAQAAGGIGGAVTAVGGGTLKGIEVCALGQFPSPPACETTDLNGEYAIEGLPAGKYRVKFEGGEDYVDRWFEDAASEFEAEVLSIGGHLTEGVDAELPAAGKVEGTVIDAVTQIGLEDVSVCARREGSFSSYCADSDAGGHYRLGGLPAGAYTIEFSAGFELGSSDYLREYYGQSPSEGEAMPVAVAAGATSTSVDAQLEKGARITGTVTDEGGNPLKGVSVCAEVAKARINFSGCGTSGADGTYSIPRLRNGKYLVDFSPGPGAAGNFLRQYYDDKPSRKLADVVTATAPATVDHVDATLHPGGRIEGLITEGDGTTPIQNASACAVEVGSQASEGGGRCAQTAADGTYAIGSLPTGNYEVVFSATNQGFGSKRWNDQPVDEAGTPIAVTAGAAVTDVDGALPQGGTVRGTVTADSDGEPIQSMEVCAFRGHQAEGRCLFTGPAGTYEFTGLDQGSYAIRFRPGVPFGFAEPSDPNYVTQWYSGQTSRASAQPLDVVPGSLIEEIDAAMVTGSRIAGLVTGPGEIPIPFAFVCATPSAEGEERCVSADRHGNYTIQGLPSGMYEVGFGANPIEGTAGWLPQWWNDETTESAANEVEVSGGVVEEIDAQLQPAGGIAGRITIAGSGAPLGEAFACAFLDGDSEPTNCAEPHPNGNYLIPMLPSGSYRVEFSSIAHLEGGDEIEEFATQFYKGAPSLGASAVVSVTAGQTTASIDAAMSEPGSNPEPPDGGGGGQPSSNPPAAPPSLAAAPPATPRPVVRRPHCRKNQKLKKVRGKWHCVKKPKSRQTKGR